MREILVLIAYIMRTERPPEIRGIEHGLQREDTPDERVIQTTRRDENSWKREAQAALNFRGDSHADVVAHCIGRTRTQSARNWKAR